MKLPKAVCTIGAPVVTIFEAGIVAGIGYLLLLTFIYVTNLVSGLAAPAAHKIYEQLPPLPTFSDNTILIFKWMFIGLMIACGTTAAVGAFLLWSKYNYERCQSFWTKKVEEGKIKNKPPNFMCIVGSPLVTVVELGAIAGVIYLFVLFVQSLPQPTIAAAPSEAELARNAHIASVFGHIALGLIITMIFVIWSKWNYTLCRKYWANGN